MLFLQNHSKNCLKSVITQCQEIPLVKCTLYGYHGMVRAFDWSCPTTGGVTRLFSPTLKTPGEAKRAGLALQQLPLPFFHMELKQFTNFSSQTAVLTIFSHVRLFFKF